MVQDAAMSSRTRPAAGTSIATTNEKKESWTGGRGCPKTTRPSKGRTTHEALINEKGKKERGEEIQHMLSHMYLGGKGSVSTG